MIALTSQILYPLSCTIMYWYRVTLTYFNRFSIDALLGGGLREGQVTEIVGPSSSGKTQVCLISFVRYCLHFDFPFTTQQDHLTDEGQFGQYIYVGLSIILYICCRQEFWCGFVSGYFQFLFTKPHRLLCKSISSFFAERGTISITGFYTVD